MHSRTRALCFVSLLISASLSEAYAMDVAARRPSSQQEYWSQIERKDWTQAVVEAEKLIESTRPRSNEDPIPLAEALTLLGNAQIAGKNFLAAEAAYSEALQILGPRLVSTSDKLLEPLRGMGHALALGGKHDAAIPYMERALLVSRRTHGVFNMNQQGLLRQLANSHMKLGGYIEAEQQMQYLVRVGEHTFGRRDPRMASVYGVLGDFYMQAGLVSSARDAYRLGLQIVEKKLGRNAIETVEPLRALADSYRRELFLSHYGIRAPTERPTPVSDPHADAKLLNPRYLNSEGERALERALTTLDTNPTRSAAVLFDTLLDLGDWHMIKSKPEEALPYYRRAVGLLDQVEPEFNAGARAKVSFPMQIYYPVPSTATRNLHRSEEQVEQKFVHTAFTVAADGSVRDERVIEENATARQVADTVNAVRAARYRPKFVNGEPVDTQDVSLRQVFKLRRERDTE